MKVSLHAFNCGWFHCRPNFFIGSDASPGNIRAPVPAYLVQHPRGQVLFDTGLGARYLRTAETAKPIERFGMQYFAGMDIATQLRNVDVDPGGIDWIVNSHLHSDHCGGNCHILNATVITQGNELVAAEASNDPYLYDAQDYATGQPVRRISGELDLFGDGLVRIVPTHGHTPGHQSMIVRLPGGEVLLAADCCYTRRNLDLMTLPANTVDIDTALVTLGRLEKLRAAGTRIIFGHDPAMWSELPEGVPL